MIGATIFVSALAILQSVSPDVQQAIRDEVQQQLREGRFQFGGGPAPWNSGPAILGELIPFALFAMIVLVVWLAVRYRQTQLRARAEFQKQVLDKFGSGKEFAEFLGTDGSRRFLESLSTQSYSSRNSIFRFMWGGITLSLLGAGFLLLAMLRRGAIVPGVLLLALGIGLLISAALTHYFAKRWSSEGPQGPGQPMAER
jgi:hypothetical protein